MAGILREVRDVAKRSGRPLSGDEAIVNRKVDELVGLVGSNTELDTVNQSLRESALEILAHENPMVRAEFQKFYFGEVEPALLSELSRAGRKPPKYLTESGKGWAHTRIGDIRPDNTEMNLGANQLKFTDFTQRYSDPVHNFKMKIYNEVARRGTGLNVSGLEYRNPRHQTTVP